MGWEKRNGHEYFYRKEREGSRVRSVYIGGGETARLIAQFAAIEADEREGERLLARMEREGWQELEAELDMLALLMDAVATGVLLAHGYHTHKRQWRMKRHG